MSAPDRDDGDFSAPTLHKAARRAPTSGAGPGPGKNPADPFSLRGDRDRRPGAGPDSGENAAAARPGTAGGPGRQRPPAPRAHEGVAGVGPDPSSSAHGAMAGPAAEAQPQTGQRGWIALLIMIGITGLGVAVDVALDTSVGVNYGIIVAALVAILVVRRTEMFPVVVAPPLVYVAASATVLVLRSGGPPSTRVLYDFAANWLVYGFPSIAAATAVVLIIGAGRYLLRR